MNPELIAVLMFGLLLLGLFMGHPLALVLGGTAVLTAVIAGKTMVLGIVINRIFGDVLDNYTLIAIPLFVLMARFLSDSGVTDRMFEALRLLLSNVRGGLALAVVFISILGNHRHHRRVYHRDGCHGPSPHAAVRLCPHADDWRDRRIRLPWHPDPAVDYADPDGQLFAPDGRRSLCRLDDPRRPAGP